MPAGSQFIKEDMKTVMYGYLLIAVRFLCLLSGLHGEECSHAVLAKRDTYRVPEGDSLSLSCVVQHCGLDGWIGEWIWTQPLENKSIVLQPTPRLHLFNESLSTNQTRLLMKFLNINKSDEGLYKCSVAWGQGLTASDQGHMTSVNTFSAVTSERNVLHRVLVCVGASLCFPLFMGLARCLSLEVKPQPVPRTLSINHSQLRNLCTAEACQAPQPPPRCPIAKKENTPQRKATPVPKPQKELVYAALSQDALGQERAAGGPTQATIYSSVHFS
ncbi:uncharacterized protein si:dkey-52l18.4 [Lampris incognitus]|uniref:uncharacterized protein si:dkey-52l18.4 n=1 Tax=Lampris incognitus TaxID=2546036 RepID=UPI0024B5A725|nr:uncharacterized protein si:dkey-52l18.4 [Lampris incognitus]XP_056140114.1 uncharacterized protein si:dkey-52l18.4 [Lampris incognitus]